MNRVYQVFQVESCRLGTSLEDSIICFNATRMNEMSIIFGL